MLFCVLRGILDGAWGCSKVHNGFGRVFLFGLLILIGLAVPLSFGESSPAQVSATGTIASRSILKNELLPFAVTLRNDSASPLSSVRLVRTPQNYELQKVCMLSSDEKVSCLARQQLASTGYLLTDTILPGQSFTMWGDLRPAVTHKPETLTLIVGWNIARTDATTYPSSLVVSLGENQVLSGFQSSWNAVSEAVKLLLIPIALAITGFFLNLFMKRREEVIGNREKLRDEARQESERDRTVRAETLKLMLPICHGYVGQYYLPLSNALEGMANALKESKEKVAFFYHLLAWQRVSKTVDAIGGFYFKDLRGEVLAAECWKAHTRAVAGKVDAPLNKATRAAITRLTADRYQVFERQFENSVGKGYVDEDIQSAWELFQNWLLDKKKVEGVIGNLEAFYSVLDYEANRPYEYWYTRVAKLKLTEGAEMLLKEILMKAKFSADEITEYFAAVQRT